MSKRTASGITLKGRKRRRNGISTTASVLDVLDTPLSEPQLMQVWHTNTTDPTTSRKSAVPIPLEPQIGGVNAGLVEESFDAIAPEVGTVPVRPKRKYGNNSVSHGSLTLCGFSINPFGQTKMETFLPLRPVVLDELLRRDGLREHLSLPQCASCLEELGKYRCIDCTASILYCAPCVVHQHENTPLHRLEV